MKSILLLMAICMVSVRASVYSQSAKFSFDIDNSPVKGILKEIEKQSKFRFLYNEDFLDLHKQVSITVTEENIGVILDQLFADASVTYRILDDDLIVITPKKAEQPAKLVGKVTDASTGDPLPGVNVLIEGSAQGVITDYNGNYSVDISRNDMVLVFSFLGYLSERIEVGERTSLDIALVPDIQKLDEVVVIGYGTQKKKLVTGATVQVKGEDIQKLSTISPLTAMQSQTPGVSITQFSGLPGSDYKVNIRGIGTIGNYEPLVIIDGIVGGELNQINPSDIESIDVLKDAASAAIYGSRAANGVILVKTKQGKVGKTSVSYDGYFGLQNSPNMPEILNAQQYVDIVDEVRENAGQPPINWARDIPEWDSIQAGWQGTDWMEEFSNKNAPMQNHSLNITGGSDLSNFSLGFSYAQQEGIYGHPSPPQYERYTIRLNSEHVIARIKNRDFVKFGENLLISYTLRESGEIGVDNIWWNDVRFMMRCNPLTPLYDENGNFSETTPYDPDRPNPIGDYYYNRSMNNNKNLGLRALAYLEVHFMKGLVFRTSYGQKYGSYSSRSYVPRYYLGSKNQATEDRISQAQSSGTGFQWENTLNYKIQLAGAHKVDLLLGQSIEKNGIGEYVNGYNSNSIFTTYENAYLDNVTTIIPGKVDLSGGPFLINSLSSFFGRLNYDYREKYLLTLIMRADGSSNFAPGNRWGYFPSVAAGWIVTNESFLDPVKGVLNYFKLRGSWGQNGNQSIPPFQYLATYSFTDVYYFFGTDKLAWTTGAYPGILPNEDISWETSEQINLGFDSRFLNSKLGLVFDWYRKNTKDWLVQAPVLATWGGATPPYINGGDIRNQGFEAALNWFDKAGAFTYGFNFNAAYNQNEVTRIENEEGIIEGAIEMFRAGQEPVYRTQVGYPIGYFYGFETAGVFQNQQQIDNFDGGIIADYPPEPGDLIFVDQNKDGVIDDLDKTMIGDPNPHIILGISANLSYKGFDFSVTANGVFGNDIAVSLHQPDSYKDNYPVEYLKRWHGEGTSDRYPRLLGNHPNYLYFSDISIEKGNYLRIQNITLGYDLKKLMPKAFLNQTRIYVAAQNPFIFTNYYGSDPEVGFAKDEWAKGVDIGFYPSPRTFMVGLNVKF